MSRIIITAALFLTFTLPATAQQPELKPKKLTITPAKAPVPALKYQLLPEVKDLEPGNAMLCYLRAMSYGSFHRATRWGPEVEAMHNLMELPFEEFKRAKKPAGFEFPTSAMQDVDRGARKETCEWELLTQLRKEGIDTRMPDVQDMRSFIYLLAYRSRLEMADGKLDKAIYTFQTFLAMSRHLAEGPTLIHDLVGVFSAWQCLIQMEDFVQQPEAPNLYWALTALPREFINMRNGLGGDKLVMEAHFPELKKMEKAPLSSQELSRLVNIFCSEMRAMNELNPADVAFPKKLALIGKTVELYPTARKALIDQGRKAEEIDALPMFQVVIIHSYQLYQRAYEDIAKWMFVPFWEGNQARQKVEAECKAQVTYPFGMFLPALGKVHFANVRVDRQIAALRCVEALRLHVAETGKVPASLSEITMVPIPLDPVTGKHFEYKAKGDLVTLFGPVPPGFQVYEGYYVSYEITIKR